MGMEIRNCVCTMCQEHIHDMNRQRREIMLTSHQKFVEIRPKKSTEVKRTTYK